MENQIMSNLHYSNFRYPSGAVPTDSVVKFEIQVPRYYALKEVYLVWINDEDHQYTHIKMNWAGIQEGRDIFHKAIEIKQPGLAWYYFRLHTVTKQIYVGKHNQDVIEMEVEPPSWQLTSYDKDFRTPDWIKGGLFYHIFIDRFAKEGPEVTRKNAVIRNDWGGIPTFAPNEFGEVVNNDFFGGNLKGIIGKLPYLHSLGVTCLYLSPIFEAFSNHKYDTGDYNKIDPMFGTTEDFNKLCKEAKKLGIEVILDGVFNHTGSDSIYFNKKETYDSLGAYQSKDSEYYRWFNFFEHPDKYESWWGIDTLPSINETDPSYLEFISGDNGISRKWLKEGANGWRLDVADELPDEFLDRFRDAVKRENQEALIIGEVWEDASHKVAYGKRRRYFQGKQLDSVMNYPFKNAIIQFIRYGDAEELHNIITDITFNYPECVVHCLMNMIGTHDTRRILTALGGQELYHATKEEKALVKMTVDEKQNAIELLKLAALIQMTLPGVPCIYYGDEVGMEGYEDPLNRVCYPWGNENKDLLSWYKKLGTIRKQLSVFKKGKYETIYAGNQVFLFKRFDDQETIVIGVNRSDQPFQIEVENSYLNLLNHKLVNNELILQPNEGCLLVQK